MNGPDYFDLFAEVSNDLEVKIETHRDQCKTLVETYVRPGADRDRLIRTIEDRSFAALKSVHSIAHAADEANSLSRHLRVQQEGAVA